MRWLPFAKLGVLPGCIWWTLAVGGVAAGLVAPVGGTTRADEVDARSGRYAGSRACEGCHPSRYASWKATFHRTMTQEVSPQHPEAVLGDFRGAEYRYAGVVARMSRDREGRFVMSFARAAGPAAGRTPVRAVVVRAVGSHRYQQYLAEVGGALWRLPMAYHIEERRWFHMNGAFLTPDPAPEPTADPEAKAVALLDSAAHPAVLAASGIPVFGGGAYDRHVTRWNDNCVFCHNVAPNPGRDRTSGAFNTSVAELGVACEACHGPSAAHAQQSRGREGATPRQALGVDAPADPAAEETINPRRLSPSRSADICGRCHGQRMADDVEPFLAHGDPFVPGEALELYSAPLWRDTPLRGDSRAFATRFWDDGTPRLTAYEYQGWLQSRCAQRSAMTCISCHEMHGADPRGQIRPSARGDLGCTSSSCHPRFARPRAQAAHAHHDVEGPGARCVACHMPRIVYGVMDLHVSHRIEIPDPERDARAGRPDACTLCHVDRGAGWARDARSRLWPARGSARAPAAAGAATARDASSAALTRDVELSPLRALFAADPVGRAVAAEALGVAPEMSVGQGNERGGSAATAGAAAAAASTARAARRGALLAAMLDEPYPAVRHLAARALSRLLARQHRALESAIAASYDATGSPSERAETIARLERALPEAARFRKGRTAWVASLRARAVGENIDIGE